MKAKLCVVGAVLALACCAETTSPNQTANPDTVADMRYLLDVALSDYESKLVECADATRRAEIAEIEAARLRAEHSREAIETAVMALHAENSERCEGGTQQRLGLTVARIDHFIEQQEPAGLKASPDLQSLKRALDTLLNDSPTGSLITAMPADFRRERLIREADLSLVEDLRDRVGTEPFEPAPLLMSLLEPRPESP